MDLQQQVREIHKGIRELQSAFATACWVSHDKIELFKGWKRSEIETFRRNNPHLCNNVSKSDKPSWVYDKNKIDAVKH